MASHWECNKRVYSEGRDYVLESRYADGDLTRPPLLANELVGLKPAVIVVGTSNAALAAKQSDSESFR